MELVITLPQGAEATSVLGPADRNIKMLREALGLRLSVHGSELRVEGERDAVESAGEIVSVIKQNARINKHLSRREVLDLIARATRGSLADAQPPDDPALVAPDGPAWREHLDVYVAGQQIRARTPNQQHYLDAMRDNDLVFGIGPAGTGKTYLAVAAAVHMLRSNRAKKVILVRPAVEAGERLGYLPGDLQAKVNPYLRPLFDALHDMMDFATIKRFMESDIVEVIPLAYMRGRTLNRSVIILDEAQNTTRGQMQMFLTRMGHGSKVIVTGDTTQIDLPDPTQSGLIDAARRLRRVPGAAFVVLEKTDIVRHPLVQRIVEAYADETPRHVRGAPDPL